MEHYVHRSACAAAILFIIAYLTYTTKIGNNRPPSLLRKIIALYAFNTAGVEVLAPTPFIV